MVGPKQGTSSFSAEIGASVLAVQALPADRSRRLNSFGATVGGLLSDGLKDIAYQADRVPQRQQHFVDDVRILELFLDDFSQLGFDRCVLFFIDVKDRPQVRQNPELIP